MSRISPDFSGLSIGKLVCRPRGENVPLESASNGTTVVDSRPVAIAAEPVPTSRAPDDTQRGRVVSRALDWGETKSTRIAHDPPPGLTLRTRTAYPSADRYFAGTLKAIASATAGCVGRVHPDNDWQPRRARPRASYPGRPLRCPWTPRPHLGSRPLMPAS